MQWLETFCQSRLAEIDIQGLTRQRLAVQNLNGRHYQINNQSYLQFASNDYLALAGRAFAGLSSSWQNLNEPDFAQGAGASPLVTGFSPVHQAFEQAIARYLGFEAALYFNSGFSANEALLGTLVRKNDLVFADRLNHASLIDGVRHAGARHIRYKHLDLDDLERLLHQHQRADGRLWIITDAVFSMDGDIAPLQDIQRLARRYGAALVIDDAHGFGVLGQGRGSCAEFDLDPCDVDLLTVTCGKALGVTGALVCGKQVVIDCLVQQSRSYIYSTAAPPMILQACLSSLQELQQAHRQRSHLAELGSVLAKELNVLALKVNRTTKEQDQNQFSMHHPVQPFIVGDIDELMALNTWLKSHGILVGAIRPPTVPKGTSRLRISLNAAHELADIHQLITTLTAFYSQQDFNN